MSLAKKGKKERNKATSSYSTEPARKTMPFRLNHPATDRHTGAAGQTIITNHPVCARGIRTTIFATPISRGQLSRRSRKGSSFRAPFAALGLSLRTPVKLGQFHNYCQRRAGRKVSSVWVTIMTDKSAPRFVVSTRQHTLIGMFRGNSSP